MSKTKPAKTSKFSPKTSHFSLRQVLAGAFLFGIVAVVLLVLASAAPPGGFETLPPGATLPSEANCAGRVRSAPEVRAKNVTYNQTKGVGGNYQNSRITGNFTGTTDQIIQWAACKWGMDEDILRAQMVKESYWTMNAYGDWTNNSANCPTILPVGNYTAAQVGQARNGQCPESLGIAQVRWQYHKSAFYSSPTENASTLTNNAIYSTAYNLDYYVSIWRSCYNGEVTWLNTVERGAEYAAGDVWGCVGLWFAGRWRTQPALDYIAAVQSELNNRTWEQSYFVNYNSTSMVLTKSGGSTPPPSGGGTSPPPAAQQPAANQQPAQNSEPTQQQNSEQTPVAAEGTVAAAEEKSAVSNVPVVGDVLDTVAKQDRLKKTFIISAFVLPVFGFAGFIVWRLWLR